MCSHGSGGLEPTVIATTKRRLPHLVSARFGTGIGAISNRIGTDLKDGDADPISSMGIGTCLKVEDLNRFQDGGNPIPPSQGLEDG